MRVPLSWLKEFCPLPTQPSDAAALDQLAETLTGLGLVVEGVERIAVGLDGVVLARVLEIEAIAGADRIRKVLVDSGGPDPIVVVCGASNFAPGDVVPLATVGAVLPGGVEIARRKIKGVTSDGMLCSARELGLSGDHAGILVLSPGATPASADDRAQDRTEERGAAQALELGRPLAQYLGEEPDVIFDISVEADRPDCHCIAGVARDLAGALRLPFAIEEPPPLSSWTASPSSSTDPVGITASVEDAARCEELLCLSIGGVVGARSPDLVVRRLLMVGMRPIHPVVDASNYVLVELGQPTHPYDLDLVGKGSLRVRSARAGERVTTLDGVERVLEGAAAGQPGDLVIADGADRPIGLAGIMGGASSVITESTRSVLLEVASFDPISVGRTARRLGLRTEASARFERGVDPGGLERAAGRIVELLGDAALGAGLPPPFVDAGPIVVRSEPARPRRVALRLGRVAALLGIEIDGAAVTELLERVEFEVNNGGEDDRATLEVTVPSFRRDVRAEIDLVEEIARNYGYERIGRTNRRSPYVGRLTQLQGDRRRLRRLLTGLHATEAWTPSVVEPAELARAGEAAGAVALRNPMAGEGSVVRTSLLPGLLRVLGRNIGHRNPWLRIFEIGHVARLDERSGSVIESERLGVLLALDHDDAATAVTAWRTLLDGLGLDEAALSGPLPSGPAAGLHPTRAGQVVDLERAVVLADLGEVDPDVCEQFGVEGRRVGYLDADLVALSGVRRRPRAIRPISRFPSADVDLAFVLEESVPAGTLQAAIAGAAGPLLEQLQLFDVYRGPGVPAGARGLTFRLRWCALDHTLGEAELSQLRTEVIAAALASCPSAQLRQ